MFADLDEKEREIAKRIFLELTQVGDTYDIRRRVCLNNLVNQYHTFEQLNTVAKNWPVTKIVSLFGISKLNP